MAWPLVEDFFLRLPLVGGAQQDGVAHGENDQLSFNLWSLTF